MTTHVVIVDKDTFQQHLKYKFIGTGNGKPFLFFINLLDFRHTYLLLVHYPCRTILATKLRQSME